MANQALQGKIVMLTGGGSGIGRRIAQQLSSTGATLIICGRNVTSLEETVASFTETDAPHLAYAMDVRNPVQVERVVTTVVSRFGGIDVLINNAGVASHSMLEDCTDEQWNEIITTNLGGVFHCCRAVVPLMRRQGNGTIIMVSSILAKHGVAGLGPYCASKFGVLGLGQSLAAELASTAIKVYIVCPGATLTPLHISLVGSDVASLSMDPSEVASVICGLAEGNMNIPSGSEIVIDKQRNSVTPHGLSHVRMKIGRLINRVFQLRSRSFD